MSTNSGRMASGRTAAPSWRVLFLAALATSLALGLLVWALGPRLLSVPHLADKGPSWYYWQLPAPRLWSRLSAWTGYALHQLAAWAVVYLAWRRRRSPSGKRTGLLNVAALGVNLFFVLLHLLQTHLWYDGLAQDVPIWTSQYSVIVMLVIILLMLIPRRGIFWGAKVRVPQRVLGFLREYHGFYIAWALVYTFWFHPMEGVYGLLIGFLYMFFLMIQMSMFDTPLHFSLRWIVFLEVFVGVHGPLIAIMKGQAIWPMFLFGFLFMFVGTQQHGLGLPRWSRWVILGAYLAGAGAAYSVRGLGRLYEIAFIPAALYGGALALGLLLAAVLSLPRRAGGGQAASPAGDGAAAGPAREVRG